MSACPCRRRLLPGVRGNPGAHFCDIARSERWPRSGPTCRRRFNARWSFLRSIGHCRWRLVPL